MKKACAKNLGQALFCVMDCVFSTHQMGKIRV